jgi:HD-GYP domain-containing protein (c-di-GMP phosphodiesterase class II)
MVRLSEIIKKNKEKKPPEKRVSIAEVVQVKPDEISPQEIEEIYESAILRIKQIMDVIFQGKTKEWREIVQIAEDIVDKFIIKDEVFLSLVNNHAQHESVSDYPYAHSVNVSILAINLGSALGYSKSELTDLCACSLIHDIGMLKISRELINKPSKLSKEEIAQIKLHPVYGLEFLLKIKDAPRTACEVIYEHHEKVDGTGYPEGKKGDEISKFAKIVAIVDIFEALTHPRPYRDGRMILFDAVKMVMQEVDRFEYKLLKTLLNYFTFYPINSLVALNNNEIGRVIDVNASVPMRPVVEIVLDADGNRLKKPKKIDLRKSHLLYIKKAIDERSLREAL